MQTIYQQNSKSLFLPYFSTPRTARRTRESQVTKCIYLQGGEERMGSVRPRLSRPENEGAALCQSSFFPSRKRDSSRAKKRLCHSPALSWRAPVPACTRAFRASHTLTEVRLRGKQSFTVSASALLPRARSGSSLQRSCSEPVKADEDGLMVLHRDAGTVLLSYPRHYLRTKYWLLSYGPTRDLIKRLNTELAERGVRSFQHDQTSSLSLRSQINSAKPFLGLLCLAFFGPERTR